MRVYGDHQGLSLLDTLGRELRVASRLLLKDRWFTTAAVTALGLGIAVSSTIFALVNGILLRDLPFSDPDRVVTIGMANGPSDRPNAGVSHPDLQDWRDASRAFEGLGAALETTMNVADEPGSPERFIGSYVSANTFRILGRSPILGRTFEDEDDRSGATPVVILGHSVWRTRYASDPRIIGREIGINGVRSVVIGVMGADVGFPVRSRLWQPLALLPAEVLNRRDARTMEGFGRLAAQFTLDQARADLSAIATVLAQRHPDTNRSFDTRIAPFRERSIGGRARSSFPVLMLMVSFVLAIACANVANLLLARAAERGREMSLRLAIGASRMQIMGQLLVESVLIALVAGLMGLALSAIGVRMVANAITGMGEGLPYWMRFEMDWRVFGFVAAVCLTTGIGCGLAPALHASRSTIVGALQNGAAGSLSVIGRRRWTTSFVMAQLALAPIVLTGAGLMMRSIVAQHEIDPGVDTAGLIRMRLDLTGARYPSAAERVLFYRQLEDRLESDSNLRAALASHAPFEGSDNRWLSLEGRPGTSGQKPPLVRVVTIGRGYFETLGSKPARGGTFTTLDDELELIPAIVNERFVEVHTAGRDPLGQIVTLGLAGTRDAPDRLRIIGLAPNIRQGSTENAEGFEPIVYVPYTAKPRAQASLIVRSDAAPSVVASLLRAHVRAVDPNLPVFDVMRLDESYARSDERVGLAVFGAMFATFAGIALLLAALGLYSVTAYATEQRTREIGLRIALGAQARQIWWLVTRRATRQVVVGLSVGIAGAVGLGQLLRGLLIGTSATDPVTLLAVSALLALVTFVASMIPARRAIRIDPIAALRSE